MAAHLFRHRRILPLLDAAAAPGVTASASARDWPALDAGGRAPRWRVRWWRQRAAIVADAGGRGLLHCDGDAASAHRCLLHRSWLRPRARRGDAVADVRNGHYQPALLRLDRRP